MRVALNWIAEDAGGNAEVAVFHHDSPFGQAPSPTVRPGREEPRPRLHRLRDAGGQPNYVGLLSQAQSQGAKYIVIQNVAGPAAQVAKDIQAQGLDMKIVCLNWCANELFINTAGADVAEGHTSSSRSPRCRPTSPVTGDQGVHGVQERQGRRRRRLLGRRLGHHGRDEPGHRQGHQGRQRDHRPEHQGGSRDHRGHRCR